MLRDYQVANCLLLQRFCRSIGRFRTPGADHARSATSALSRGLHRRVVNRWATRAPRRLISSAFTSDKLRIARLPVDGSVIERADSRVSRSCGIGGAFPYWLDRVSPIPSNRRRRLVRQLLPPKDTVSAAFGQPRDSGWGSRRTVVEPRIFHLARVELALIAVDFRGRGIVGEITGSVGAPSGASASISTSVPS